VQSFARATTAVVSPGWLVWMAVVGFFAFMMLIPKGLAGKSRD
jgi:hypothetical protein